MLKTDELAAIPPILDASYRISRTSRARQPTSTSGRETMSFTKATSALFVVLSGNIHVTKLIDGIERKVGERLPGNPGRESPSSMARNFKAAGACSEPSRVLRVEARQYYAVAAASPELAKPSAISRASASAGCRA